MSNAYLKTVNENGGGYVKRAPVVRSKDRIDCDLSKAKQDLANAIVNADYENNADGTGYRVERMEKRVAELTAELAA